MTARTLLGVCGLSLWVLLYAAAAPAPGRQSLSGDDGDRFFVDITAEADIHGEKPVEIPFPKALRQRASRVVEHRDGRSSLTSEGTVPWQQDEDGTLTVLVSGLAAKRPKRLAVYVGQPHGLAQTPRVTVDDNALHQGQASLRIRTPDATYVYHKEGGGFASIVDRDGNDWISYRPGNGSAGEFRGIPNLGECCHPGYNGAKGARTTLEADGPLKARFRSESVDGRWAATWDVYPSYARMTLQRAGGPYWFLYEGTPGGKIDLAEDFWVTSDGTRRSVADDWRGDLTGPEWVYFADGHVARALFVANHQDDTANDQFWQMESNMTVWGFGREYRCCGRYLTVTPASFSIGLLETRDHARASQAIASATAAPTVVVGPLESRTNAFRRRERESDRQDRAR